METSDNIRFVFGLLDNINENIEAKSTDAQSYLNITEIRIIVDNNLKSKNYKFSNHGQRVVHFILYLNTELSNCEWVKEDTSLNLKRYVHGKPLSNTIYYKVVDVLNLKPFIFETIMCTPYSFCSDLIEIYSNKIKAMDGLSQLVATEKLIVALMKSIRRAPVKSNSESSVTNHFNQAMLVFGKDNLPHDIRRLDFEDEQKEITKYNGFRVKSIFNILIEIIKFKSIPDTYRLYPMYKLKSLRSSVPSTDTGHIMFKKFLDVIMYKCMNMCNFSIDTWLAWYEVEVVEEDTNLQATIGHLCYELCSLIDNGTINEPVLREFQPILRNIAIEKIDFSNVDTTNIDEMIKGVENSSRFHINSWIKKMIQNPDVFVHNNAIPVISHHIDCIDYNCFKAILDSVMAFYKNGGVVSEATGNLIFKGIKRLDVEDKMTVLKQFLVHYADCTFYISNEFDKQFHYVAHNEYNENIDQQELLSILIWLMMQQPKKILNLLIAQYITGICGLRPKGFDSKRSCLHQGMVSIHLYMDSSYIYQEYKNWFSIYSSLSDFEQGQLHQWILGVTKRLHFMKTETFLTHIIIPILNPSPDYCLLKYLTYLTKYLVEDCQIIVSHLHSWDKIVIQLATLLDHVRWDIHNYSPIRVEICESIISTIQPLLHHNIRSRSIDLGLLGRTVQNVKQRLSGLHLMTRSHFLRLWTSEYITIDGMDEQLIMTVHSQSHISYSNLNKSSTQRAQEEFIFSIATFMPKFTSYEMKSFIANYLSSAKPPNLVDASYFLLDCMMNSVMRIIVYLKTATQNESSDNRCEWNYVHRAIVDFFAAVNASKMCCIYDEDVNVSLAINTMTKIIMVIKQVADREMSSLTAMLCRLIEVTQSRMTVEEISKILSLLASIKAQDYKDSLKAIMQGLMDKLLHKKQLNVGKDNMCK